MVLCSNVSSLHTIFIFHLYNSITVQLLFVKLSFLIIQFAARSQQCRLHCEAIYDPYGLWQFEIPQSHGTDLEAMCYYFATCKLINKLLESWDWYPSAWKLNFKQIVLASIVNLCSVTKLSYHTSWRQRWRLVFLVRFFFLGQLQSPAFLK